MIKKASVSLIVLLILAAATVWYYCFYILPSDLQRYSQDLQLRQQHNQTHCAPPCVEQTRRSVTKDIWIFHPSHTEHHHIAASQAHLVIKKCSSTWSAKEHLIDVTCRLEASQSQVKHLAAPEAFFDYKTKSFDAEQVVLSVFEPISLKSVTIPQLTAKARDVHFTLNQPTLTFSAKQMTALSLDNSNLL